MDLRRERTDEGLSKKESVPMVGSLWRGQLRSMVCVRTLALGRGTETATGHLSHTDNFHSQALASSKHALDLDRRPPPASKVLDVDDSIVIRSKDNALADRRYADEPSGHPCSLRQSQQQT